MLLRVQHKVYILRQHDVIVHIGADEFALFFIEISAVFIPQSQLIRLFLLFCQRTDCLFIRPLCRAVLRAAPVQTLRLLAVLASSVSA